MINYDDLMKRILLQSNTEKETDEAIEYIYNLDRKEFFTFLKSMALLVITQQQEIKTLKSQSAQSPNQSSDSSK